MSFAKRLEDRRRRSTSEETGYRLSNYISQQNDEFKEEARKRREARQKAERERIYGLPGS